MGRCGKLPVTRVPFALMAATSREVSHAARRTRLQGNRSSLSLKIIVRASQLSGGAGMNDDFV